MAKKVRLTSKSALQCIISISRETLLEIYLCGSRKLLLWYCPFVAHAVVSHYLQGQLEQLLC